MAETDTDTEVKPAPPVVKTVPQDRFNAVVQEKRALAERVATLEAEGQSLTERAATADTLAKQIADLTASHRAKESAWGEERALLGAGITDPEDADLVRYQYGRVPEKDRPKTITDYLTNLRAEAAKPDGAIPKALAHVFATQVAKVEPKPEPATANGKPPPKTPGNTGKHAPTSDPVTVDAVKALRLAAQASGKPEDWKAWEAAADAAMKGR